MSRMPVPGSARGGLAAAVIGACALTAACGNVQAGNGGAAAGGSPAASQPTPAASQPASASCTATPAPRDHTVTFTKADNGKVACVARGMTVAVYLQGTAARRWGPIHASSPALTPVANGRLALRVGMTGAFFKAVKPGVAVLTSALASCPGGEAGRRTPSPAGAPCKMGTVFRLTLVVQ